MISFTKQKSYKLKDIYAGHNRVTYRGVLAIKCPYDYVLYQMLITEIRPDLVIEIGTNKGGSSLYLADLLELNGLGELHTIDLPGNKEDILLHSHPRIKVFKEGYSGYETSKLTSYKKIMVIEDGSHQYEDVLATLQIFSPFVTPGSYFIVEDGFLTEMGMEKQFNGGPQKAIYEFLGKNSNYITDRRWCDFFGPNATFNVNGYLKKLSGSSTGKQTEGTGKQPETFVPDKLRIEHIHRYALAMELAAGKKVLDISCAEGKGTSLLATKVDHEFDLVTGFETLEHLSILKEMKRVLKPGGLLIISIPYKKRYPDARNYKDPFPVNSLYQDECKAQLESVFAHVQVLDQQLSHVSFINAGMMTGLEIYSGNFDKLEKNKPVDPDYLIALASDEKLPVLPNSLFTGNSIAEQALAEQEKMITNTITYRLGHFILYPFKIIRKLFTK